MTSSASSPFQLKHEYDGFLFATVGEDKRGMPLSVVSVLARLDVDPWQEAAALKDLPKEGATRRLASLIAKLPADQLDRLDGRQVAARLIAFLPPKRVARTHEEGEGGVKRDPRIAMFVFFAMSMLVAFTLSIHQTPPAAPHPSTTSSAAVSPKPANPARPATAPQAQKTGK